MLERAKTEQVHVADITIGSSSPIVIQSMVSSSTLDISGCVEESIKIIEAGGEMVRFTAASVSEANAIGEIKSELVRRGYMAPLVADVHFNPQAAMVAAEFADKVRINPGNFIDPRAKFVVVEYSDSEYADELQRLDSKFLEFLSICRSHNTAIRIGVNHGSLSDRIMSRYGDTTAGMCESAMEFLRICKREGFTNVVVSMKSSNVTVMVEAYRMIFGVMRSEGMNYPLHLGVTEAGEGEDGRVKSSLGIATLLAEGIGDTIRVSLTEPSWHEIDVARAIVSEVENCAVAENNHPIKMRKFTPQVVFDNTVTVCELSSDMDSIDAESIESIDNLDQIVSNEANIILYTPRSNNVAEELSHFFARYEQLRLNNRVVIRRNYCETSSLKLTVKMAAELGRTMLSGYGDYWWITNSGDMIEQSKLLSLIFSLLQASRARISRTEFISCPSCGRTQFAISEVVAKVKKQCSRFKGLKIAVMGCNVNGPGEMADADYGYIGCGKGKISLYRGKERVVSSIAEKDAVSELVKLIESEQK